MCQACGASVSRSAVAATSPLEPSFYECWNFEPGKLLLDQVGLLRRSLAAELRRPGQFCGGGLGVGERGEAAELVPCCLLLNTEKQRQPPLHC